MYLRNTAAQYVDFALINVNTGAALLGAAVSGFVTRDGNAQQAVTGTIDEMGNGQYRLAMSAADIDGNACGFLFTAALAIPTEVNIITEAAGAAPAAGGPGAVDIVNKALRRLGIAPVTALGTDGTVQDNLMSAIYVDVAQEVMRQHPWNVLRARRQLQYTTTPLTLSSAAIGTGITATAGAGVFSPQDVGSTLRETLVVGASGVSNITAYISPTQVTLTTTVAWTTVTVGANAWLLAPIDTDFQYIYMLPSDFLCARSLDGATTAWQVEGKRLLTTAGNAIIHYTRYESDASLWEVLLQEAIVAKLAMEGAWPLTKDLKLVDAMSKFFVAKLAEAMGTNKSERQPIKPRVSPTTLIDVR